MTNEDIKHPDRRNFLKNTSLIAGGILAAPLFSQANYFSGASDVIKIALIGCGGRGTGAATQALSTKQNVQLVAMADAFKDRLDDSYNNLLEALPDKKDRIQVKEENKFIGFDAYKHAIALADVVILATPPGFRPIHFGIYRSGRHTKSISGSRSCKSKKTECSGWFAAPLPNFVS